MWERNLINRTLLVRVWSSLMNVTRDDVSKILYQFTHHGMNVRFCCKARIKEYYHDTLCNVKYYAEWIQIALINLFHMISVFSWNEKTLIVYPDCSTSSFIHNMILSSLSHHRQTMPPDTFRSLREKAALWNLPLLREQTKE